MKTLLSTEARRAFDKQDYERALELYKTLAANIGEANFEYNIRICNKEIENKNIDNDVNNHIESGEQKWMDICMSKVEKIKDSNGCKYYSKLPIRIGIICDEFFFDSIYSAANFIYITPDNWKDKLEEGIDVFLFVSAWRGIHNEWKGLASSSLILESLRKSNKKIMGCEIDDSFHMNECQKIVFNIIQECKNKNISTIFYSKEDPPNFWIFIEYAKVCDFIFTSSQECVSEYIRLCGHTRVSSIYFGINPQMHNPIGICSIFRDDAVIFSGSWMIKYPQRGKDLKYLFNGIQKTKNKLHIIDRNYGLHKSEKYDYPKEYKNNISPSVPHNIIQKVHKTAHWAININSVTASETMFANRSFELQACGVNLLSNFSVGVHNLLPNISIALDEDEVYRILNGFSNEERYERQISGIREVMTGHVCHDRVAQLLSPFGINAQQVTRSVLVLVDRINSHVQECFDNQTYAEKQLYLTKDITSVILSKFDMVTWFDSKAEYSCFYLEDMINAFKYTACDYITKDSWYDGDILHEGVEHDYVEYMKSIYRTVFWVQSFTIDDILNMHGVMNIKNGYSIDRLNYNKKRCGHDVKSWLSQKIFRKKYKLSVIIPVYNNGDYLYKKCFSSLMRSSIFHDMEIILVDDGSTDTKTISIEKFILKRHANVRYFAFHDGGSGSASRPRNKGVEMATSPFIAFLDPDNEAICDGYAALLDYALNNSCDIVFGNMYKCDKQGCRIFNHYYYVKKICEDNIFHDEGRTILVKTKFRAPSIQAMVVRKEILLKNKLAQVVESIGQDTLMSWQLIDAAKICGFINTPIHIYYGQTRGSVTNSINPQYFKKLLILQKEKCNWLVKFRYIEHFMEDKYIDYFEKGIFLKLSLADSQCADECVMIIWEMIKIFENYVVKSSEMIDTFCDFCKNGQYKRAYDTIINIFHSNNASLIPPMSYLFEICMMRYKLNNVVYSQNGSSVTFQNLEFVNTDSKYAWVILEEGNSYNKIYQSKYSRDNKFTYDFFCDRNINYRIRAFVIFKGVKVAGDIAYIKSDDSGAVVVDVERTVAIPKEYINVE